MWRIVTAVVEGDPAEITLRADQELLRDPRVDRDRSTDPVAVARRTTACHGPCERSRRGGDAERAPCSWKPDAHVGFGGIHGAGLSGAYPFHVYAAAKSAIIAFTRALANAYWPQGIRANAIAPGLVLTDRRPHAGTTTRRPRTATTRSASAARRPVSSATTTDPYTRSLQPGTSRAEEFSRVVSRPRPRSSGDRATAS